MSKLLTRTEVLEQVRKIAADQVGADPATITEETHFYSDLNFDRLDAVDFTMTLEDTFDVSIPDPQAQEVRRVGEAAETVCAALGIVPAPVE